MSEKTIENFMTKSPHVLHEASSVKTAMETMNGLGIKHLPVLNASDQISGILSLTDIENLTILLENSSSDVTAAMENLTVRDLMTVNVVTITKDKTVTEANDLLLSKGIRALPVMEDGKVIGIISESDILHYFNSRPDDEK